MGSLGGREVRGGPKYEPMEVVQNPKSGEQFSRPAFQILCPVPARTWWLATTASLNPSPIQLAMKGAR